MSVPNTSTFTLQDVKSELGSSSNDLVSFFSEALSAGFDPAYSGAKNNLLNFRNYTNTLLPGFFMSSSSYGSRSLACGSSPIEFLNLFHDGSGALPISGDKIYTNDAGTILFVGTGNFYKIDDSPGFYSVTVNSLGVCTSTPIAC